MGVYWYVIPASTPTDPFDERAPSFELGKGLWCSFSLERRSVEELKPGIIDALHLDGSPLRDWADRIAPALHSFLEEHDWSVRVVNDGPIDFLFHNIVASVYDKAVE